MIEGVEWKEISFPALHNVRSTERDQPLARDLWPTWAGNESKFSGLWLTPLSTARCLSTDMLATGDACASIDVERSTPTSSGLTYYRFGFIETVDGRTFQTSPIKSLEYERHRGSRPIQFRSHPTWSTSTGDYAISR